MKKILSVIFASLLLFGVAFADDAGARSVHWLGFNIPVQNQTWSITADKVGDFDFSSSGDIEFDLFSSGFNIFYNHLKVKDNRFTKIVDVQLGYTNITIDDWTKDGQSIYLTSDNVALAQPTSASGFDTRWMFGIGAAPLNIDRVILAVNGTFGVNMKIATGSDSYYSSYYRSGYDIDSVFWGVSTFIGANVQCAVRLGDSFGLSAGMHMYTNLLGVGIGGWKYSSSSSDSELKTYTAYVIMPGRFNIDFKFGVCWILE